MTLAADCAVALFRDIELIKLIIYACVVEAEAVRFGGHGGMTTFDPLLGPVGGFMIAVLGGFGLFWGASVLRVPRASQRLLAFLALHGGAVERAAVAGTLWPDASERHAYSNLRSALARLQARLARRWRQASLSSAWPRASRLTSATPKRSPGGCLIRQLRPIGPS